VTSVRVPGFTPSWSGFQFANYWSHVPLRTFQFTNKVKLSIGDAANGLCGGMCFTSADLHLIGQRPGDAPQPEAGSARFDYIVRRQLDSFAGIRVPLRFYKLMSPTRPAREPCPSPRTGRIGVRRHSRSHVMINDEWPKVRSAIDAGHLAMVGLIRVVGRDPFMLNRNHQVMAYGYDLEGSQLTLRIYDPNWPNDDDVTLHLDVSDPKAQVAPIYSRPDGPVLCFFRAPYRPRYPDPWR
jgi:hypothetical protein